MGADIISPASGVCINLPNKRSLGPKLACIGRPSFKVSRSYIVYLCLTYVGRYDVPDSTETSRFCSARTFDTERVHEVRQDVPSDLVCAEGRP